MKALLLKYLIRFVFGAIALGVGIWYISSSIGGNSLSYTNIDTFMNSIGVVDGDITSANGCFLCGYINELFTVLGNAAEKFWTAILENLWMLMVVGFGIFLFVHTIKYFYKAITDTATTVGASSDSGSSASSGKSSSNNAKTNTASGGDTSSPTSSSLAAAPVLGGSGGGKSSEKQEYRYAQLEWLESDGAQKMITNAKITDTTGIKIKFNQSAPGDQMVVGAWPSKAFGIHLDGNMFLPFDEDWSTGGNVGIVVATNSDYEVSINYMNDRKRYVNGVSKLDITNTLSGGGFISLFGREMMSNGFQGKIYYLKITNGASLVCDLVPVQRIGNGVLGMYDLISHEFLPNIGGGNFTAGPVVGYLEKIN